MAFNAHATSADKFKYFFTTYGKLLDWQLQSQMPDIKDFAAKAARHCSNERFAQCPKILPINGNNLISLIDFGGSKRAEFSCADIATLVVSGSDPDDFKHPRASFLCQLTDAQYAVVFVQLSQPGNWKSVPKLRSMKEAMSLVEVTAPIYKSLVGKHMLQSIGGMTN
ncbi:MAG: hypothetical protein Q9160_008950 [Pyrenula sp. 1 TL-2023]